MKIHVKVECQGRVEKFPLFIGDGVKTFKWLGNVVSQRFSMKKPRGMIRHREVPQLVGQNCNYNISSIEFEDDKIRHIDPFSLICEEISPEEEILIKINNPNNVTQKGSAVHTNWSFIAYRVSEKWNEERQIRREQWKSFAKAEQKRLQEEEDKRNLIKNKAKADSMRQILFSQIYSDSRIKDSFKKEWESLNVFGELDKLLPDTSQQRVLQKGIRKHYILLSEVFKHYCCVISSRDSSEMDHMEFNMLLKDIGLANTISSFDFKSLFVQAFTRSKKMDEDEERAMARTGIREISQSEFFLLIARVAYYCFNERNIIDQFPGVAVANGFPKKPNFISAERYAELPNLEECINILVKDHLEPLVRKELFSVLIKEYISRDDILAIFADYNPFIINVFKAYCSEVSGKGKNLFRDTIRIESFERCINDSLLVSSSTGQKLSKLQIRQAFQCAQGHDELEDSRNSSEEDTGDSPQVSVVKNDSFTMSYPEFLTALAIIAHHKNPDPKKTFHGKLDACLRQVSKLMSKEFKDTHFGPSVAQE